MSRTRHPHERNSRLAYRRWRRRNAERDPAPRDQRRSYDVVEGENEYECHAIMVDRGRTRLEYRSGRAELLMVEDARRTPWHRRRRSVRINGCTYRRVKRLRDGSIWGLRDGQWKFAKWDRDVVKFVVAAGERVWVEVTMPMTQ